ncbi:MAG: hypothetical protein GYB64_04415 [Chloroflexi bacterium]|nr:hypothetical protein [Chloroflexota bacterium]
MQRGQTLEVKPGHLLAALLEGVARLPSAQALLPLEGWQNRTHLNVVGAEVFSRWLGEQLAHSDLLHR